MKVYRFVVRKVLKGKVEIREKSYKKALERLLETLEVAEKLIFSDLKEEDQDFEIKLTTIADDFESYEGFFDDDVNGETIDEIPEEYKEIVCENCGNCIPIDEDLMS